MLCALAINLFVALKADWLVAIFNQKGNAELAIMAERGLRIYVIGFFFAGLNLIGVYYLSATEQAGPSFFISISRGLLFVIPVVWVLSKLFKIEGIWITFFTVELLTFLLTLYYCRRNVKLKNRTR